MIQIGETVPDMGVRTDEGTPLSLADLKGRAIAIFLLGESFSPTGERLLSVLADSADQFMAFDMSPIPILGETADSLADYREANDVPFLLISDKELRLHKHLRGDDGEGVGVWIVDTQGKIIDTIPVLPPTELTRVVLERIARSHPPKGPKK
ncbi:MAG: redoxin domain-containing protein [Myxococcota bacterium]|nr:redoxin domain-containing protein [Myxococcota bacterium]